MGLPHNDYVFLPTTPLETNKYSKISRVIRKHSCIGTAQFCCKNEAEPQYLPPKWAEYINPEGNLYYARNSVPRVVTNAYMPNPHVQDQMQSIIEAFEVAVCKEQILLPQSAELFLEPSVSGPCLYYLVDHAIRVVFWIYPTATENLSLHPVVSDSHLKIQLEALYWQHVEFFPAHPVDNFNLMLDNLTDVLIQGRADGLMSTVSTFPYNPKECSQFLKLIQTAREAKRETSVHTKWSFARLWTMILNTRFEAHYGQENCRLSRDQGILEVPVTQSTFCYRTCVRLLWNVPLEYSKSLEALWVDDVIYGNLWCQFVSVCLKEWAISVSISFGVMMCNLLLPTFSVGFMTLTILVATISIVSGSVLLFGYHRCTSDSASQAANFMAKACKEKTRFRTTSIIFSLPRSLLIWALIFTLIRVSALFAVSMGISTTIGLALLIVAAGCGFVLIRMAQKLFKNVRRSKTLHVQNQECKV